MHLRVKSNQQGTDSCSHNWIMHEVQKSDFSFGLLNFFISSSSKKFITNSCRTFFIRWKTENNRTSQPLYFQFPIFFKKNELGASGTPISITSKLVFDDNFRLTGIFKEPLLTYLRTQLPTYLPTYLATYLATYLSLLFITLEAICHHQSFFTTISDCHVRLLQLALPIFGDATFFLTN
jgi:hypothetical protein